MPPDPPWGRITRFAVNPRHWPILPPRIFANGHTVKSGWSASEPDPQGSFCCPAPRAAGTFR
ncbi:DUF5994 family protein [Streptomyces sp. V4I8]|uniref:DUF5994 family protein n=1 Tax=Streptomyces sp. V4I8 TaxID=3156469 RepID=UPI003513CE91